MPSQTIQKFLTERPGSRVALVVHQRPDGDAIGSGMGLAALLRDQGYHPQLVNPQPVPRNLDFLIDADLRLHSKTPEWWRDFDCLGVLDCGELNRLDEINQSAVANLPTFNIDHHVTSSGLGQAIWIESGASSTGEMLVRLCQSSGWRMNSQAAQALWTAIITDTGRFSYENATANALAAARECVLAGADPVVAAREIYQSVSYPERRLQAKVLERLELHAAGKLAISWLSHVDFEEVGVGVEGAQDLINLVRDTAGVEVAIFLYEPAMTGPGKSAMVKISLRTQAPRSALDIAVKYGGGGHTRAAGASILASMEEARVRILADAVQIYFPAEI